MKKESISFAAIGAGAIAHELYETNRTINDNTYLLGFMNADQIDECVDAYYNFVDVYGHNDDFIDECVDTKIVFYYLRMRHVYLIVQQCLTVGLSVAFSQGFIRFSVAENVGHYSVVFVLRLAI